jgi:hypothetical protein
MDFQLAPGPYVTPIQIGIPTTEGLLSPPCLTHSILYNYPQQCQNFIKVHLLKTVEK